MTTREMLRITSCESLLTCVARKLREYAAALDDSDPATATEMRMDAEAIETKLRMVRGEQ